MEDRSTLAELITHYSVGSIKGTDLIKSGLIHQTWRIVTTEGEYIIQRINTNVFERPEAIAANLEMLKRYIGKNNADYRLITPVNNREGKTLTKIDQELYRMIPFVKESHTIDTVGRPDQAYEAAFQFGKFTQVFAAFDAQMLTPTIPSFHDLVERYRAYENAVKGASQQRLNQASRAFEKVNKYVHLVEAYDEIRTRKLIMNRVTHHDTKISNVLFDRFQKGICVIDLDTVMAGYFISDLGDMMRTYLCPVSEEEPDFKKIHVREEIFEGVIAGYLETMADELNELERRFILYSGKFMICMQALRFLTDFLNNDVYYGARYDGHNLVRAENQLHLLGEFCAKEEVLAGILRRVI